MMECNARHGVFRGLTLLNDERHVPGALLLPPSDPDRKANTKLAQPDLATSNPDDQ